MQKIMDSIFLQTFFIIGITAEAMSGGLLAGKKKMDIIGVMFIGIITAIGGGSIRDVLFDHHPLVWIKNPQYILILALASVLAIRIPRVMAKLEKTFLILDAIGLVVFSIIGTMVIMEIHKSMILAIVGGAITGVFGGILRDILCNEIPLIFHKEIYASVSILSSALFYALVAFFDVGILGSAAVTMVFGVSARLLVIYYRLRLPVIDFDRKG